MNAFELYPDDGAEVEYRARTKTAPSAASRTARSKQGFGKRRGKAPQQFNGIHRRRKKQIRW